jgi:HemY protein
VARRTQALRLKLQASRMARQPLEALHTAHLLANHQAFSPAVAQGLLRSLAFEAIDGTHDLAAVAPLWEQLDAPTGAIPSSPRGPPCVPARWAPTKRAATGCKPYWDKLAALARDEREQVALA